MIVSGKHSQTATPSYARGKRIAVSLVLQERLAQDPSARSVRLAYVVLTFNLGRTLTTTTFSPLVKWIQPFLVLALTPISGQFVTCIQPNSLRFKTETICTDQRNLDCSAITGQVIAPTSSPAPSEFSSNGPSLSLRPSLSVQPSAKPSISQMPSSVPSAEPSGADSLPSVTPSVSPSKSPSSFPSSSPSFSPSKSPSVSPSVSPSSFPSFSPLPSSVPSTVHSGSDLLPSKSPSLSPSSDPSSSFVPTVKPKGDCPWWKFLLCLIFEDDGDNDQEDSPTMSPSYTPSAFPFSSLEPTGTTTDGDGLLGGGLIALLAILGALAATGGVVGSVLLFGGD